MQVDLQARLSPDQQHIVDLNPGIHLVGAPAGSGKTRVMVNRIRALLASKMPADRILCLTFTQKAAAEISARLHHEIGLPASGLWCHTFHSFALQCLRSPLNGDLPLGHFELVEQSVAMDMLFSVGKELFRERAPTAKQCKKLYRDWSRSINCNELASVPLKVGSLSHEETDVFLDAFVERKWSERFFDYDDLLFNCAMLLDEDPQFREFWSERFVYVCVDEYQDVNDLQARMLQSLTSHHRNLLAIGDRAQAIYGFRGANVNHFDNFSAQFSDASIFHLTHNFRSTATIVQAAELLFHDASDFRMRSVEAVRGDGLPIQLVGCTDAEAEARFIAREFKTLEQMGHPWNEMAVLVRLNRQVEQVARILGQNHIPVRTNQVDEPQLSYEENMILGLLALSEHRANYEHVLQALHGLFGVASALQLNGLFHDRFQCVGFAEVASILTGHQHQLWIQIQQRLCGDRISAEANLLQILMVAGLVVTESIERAIAQWSQGRSEREIRQFLIASQTVAAASRNRSVTVSSIHRAKGLEWDHVYVAGLSEGILPFIASMHTSDELEEERRLMYVACTRARERLYLSSYANSGEEFSALAGNQSRFLRSLFYRSPGLFEGVWISDI